MMFSRSLGFLVTAAALVTATPFKNNGSSTTAPTVTIKNGTIAGNYLPSFGIDEFFSIPFAAPPVGNLRFRHPQPPSKWNGTLDATEHGPSCPGFGPFSEGRPLDEDCLTLDVVRPSGGGKGLPVMVWIYGGGFSGGASADPRYNLSYIVNASVAIKKPVIAIGINYRLAGFGFLAGQDVFNSGNSNAGLFDQRQALRWIRENVEAFGGDKDKVTIWGESAGAYSVGYHLLANNGDNEGLFRAAILQSGSPPGPTLNSLGHFDEMYNSVVDILGCSNTSDRLQCLREVPYEQLFDALQPQLYTWTPVVDGDFIPGWPSDRMAAGKFANVTILIGANTDEGTATFFGPRNIINTTEDLRNYLLNGSLPATTPSSVEKLLELYPDDPALGCPFNTGSERFADQGYQYKRAAAIVGDYAMDAGRRQTSEAFANRGNKVFSYRFDQSPWNGKLKDITEVAPVYSTHYAEIGFVFNNPSTTISTYVGPDPAVNALSRLISRSWISFAHDLDPNNHGIQGAAKWPEYKYSASNIVFNSNRTYVEKDDYRKEQLNFWGTIWHEVGC
ncbi:uncharacterized protein LAJ45_00192 [Morchella importuna]|uniref:uncharacterized protein n=1 Tax=Morchella importuna TaxID=1174673 RepID=UPI001E8E509C|nr:uncharacterized protein LAJ45_00192 [Morchella importuna]KAH8155183.1 hypothetical protein LAJ45_00192 [Morchella importuna]